MLSIDHIVTSHLPSHGDQELQQAVLKVNFPLSPAISSFLTSKKKSCVHADSPMGAHLGRSNLQRVHGSLAADGEGV